jgi:hypothetical protein
MLFPKDGFSIFQRARKMLVFAGIITFRRVFPKDTMHTVMLFLEDGKSRPWFSRELRGFSGRVFAD